MTHVIVTGALQNDFVDDLQYLRISALNCSGRFAQKSTENQMTGMCEFCFMLDICFKN